MSDTWFEALGRPVSDAGRQAALDLLLFGTDQPWAHCEMVLDVVCREIAHDEPDRAQRYLRSFLPAAGSETFLFRILAALCATPEDG